MRARVYAALAAALLAPSAPAVATETVVKFSMNDGATPIAYGTFSYDSSLSGQLTYADLDSFSFTLPGGTYDLGFVNSGSFGDFYYFGFDTTLGTFVTANIDGYPEILSAIKDDYSSGFFARFDPAFDVVRNYNPESFDVSYTTLSILTLGDSVPEPATWAMMLLGFGAVGAAARRSRRKAAAFA